jgi:hypothetical protein
MYPLPEEVDLLALTAEYDLDAPKCFWFEILDSQVSVDNESQSRKLAGS